jgi:uroporphyrinogen-III synthase
VRPTHVILTQPALRAAPLAQALGSAGHRVALWPLIDAGPEPGLDWPALFADLSRSDWVVFPSPAAVAAVLAEAVRHGLDWPSGTGIALVGPGSREEVERWTPELPGLSRARFIQPASEPFDAAALAAHPALAALAGRSIVVLRRDDGRQSWPALLAARGATVREVVAYRASPCDPPASGVDWLAARRRDDSQLALSIASADAGERLAVWAATALPDADRQWLLARPVLTIHPRIAQALAQAGWQAPRLHAPGTEALLRRVESLGNEQP